LARVVVTAMSPILADGLRPVGGAWPAGEEPRFGADCKEGFCEGANESSDRGNYFPRARRARQASTTLVNRQINTPRLTRLFTRI
jgi:hypothetical protein